MEKRTSMPFSKRDSGSAFMSQYHSPSWRGASGFVTGMDSGSGSSETALEPVPFTAGLAFDAALSALSFLTWGLGAESTSGFLAGLLCALLLGFALPTGGLDEGSVAVDEAAAAEAAAAWRVDRRLGGGLAASEARLRAGISAKYADLLFGLSAEAIPMRGHGQLLKEMVQARVERG